MEYSPLLQWTAYGLYCPAGDFFIDPIRPVAKAIITHAHSDHARPGMRLYVAHHDTIPLLRLRLGDGIQTVGMAYGEKKSLNGVNISLHPAGHIIGSAMVRLSYKGQVAVISGDYHNTHSPYCTPLEIVPCHTFVTESTFGIAPFKWKPEQEIMDEIANWIQFNQSDGRASVLICYALGKAQRVISALSERFPMIYTHNSVQQVQECLRTYVPDIPRTEVITSQTPRKQIEGQIIVAPPGILKGNWLQQLPVHRTAYLSGWAQLKSRPMARFVDTMIALSDHADFAGLESVCLATGAENFLTCHGYDKDFALHLRLLGKQATTLIPQPVLTLF
jgi:putative mRNA 3-end processing factor